LNLVSHDKTIEVDHLRRIGALRRKLTRAGLSGLLVTHLPDLRYLCGFTGSSAVLAVTRRSARMFTDGRYIAQANAEVQGAQVEIVSRAPAVVAIEWLAAQLSTQPDQFAGFDPTHTTVADLHRWKAVLPAKLRRNFVTPIAAPLVEPLRLVKDEDELRPVLSSAAASSITSSAISVPGCAKSKSRPNSSTGRAFLERRECPSTPSLPRASAPPFPTATPPSRVCPGADFSPSTSV
jgi:hypothetical protein